MGATKNTKEMNMADTNNNREDRKEGEDHKEDQGEVRESVPLVVDRGEYDKTAMSGELEGKVQELGGAMTSPDVEMQEVQDGKWKWGGEEQDEVQEEPGEEARGKPSGDERMGMGDRPEQGEFGPEDTSSQDGNGGVRAGNQVQATWAAGRAYPKARMWQPVFTRMLTTFVELWLDTKEVAQPMKALVEQIKGLF